MELKQFLHLLRQKDGITIQFSHLGYVVMRDGEILDQRGNHSPVSLLHVLNVSEKSVTCTLRSLRRVAICRATSVRL